MRNQLFLPVIVCCAAILTGCATVSDIPKKIWGSSTSALERARPDAVRQDFACAWSVCYDAVLAYVQTETEQEIVKPLVSSDIYQPAGGTVQAKMKRKMLDLFLQNRAKKMMVVMDVPGSVNTTEVGIFFTPGPDQTTTVEVVSLSSAAKAKVSEMVFEELGKAFPSK